MELTLNDKCFAEFQTLIHELTGITIAANRILMVEGRLRKRISALNIESYERYLELVRKDKLEQVSFVDLITTNETSFFRTPRIWEYIENTLLPQWTARHPQKVFSAWSAAASSGEEAHSLGVLCQSFKEKNPSFLYQIQGTDISSEMIGLCQQGTYSGRSIEGFKKSRPELFERHMRKAGADSYQVAPEIKSRLRFQQHNLFLPFIRSEKFDLILLRNVLIYFTMEDQEKVLARMEPCLAEDGTLIIGESETLSHIRTHFKSEQPLIYSKAKVG